MKWSFSRINSFKNCPYAWLQQYIMEENRENGYYGEYGSYLHEILEKYFKGELEIFDLVDYYEDNYDTNVTTYPPQKLLDLAERYHEEGRLFFENFEFDFEKYEILGVEQELDFYIGEFKFTGFIDLLLKDKVMGDILILDYKTSDPYKGATSPAKKKIEEYSLQQYLYAYAIYKKMGVYPSKLRLWFLRFDKTYDIEFNEEDMNNAIKWATDEINKITLEEDWKPLSSYWFCSYLCSVRSNCEYKIFNKGQ